MKINLRASNHACKRAKKRLRWNSYVLNRMLKIAYYQGIKIHKNKNKHFYFLFSITNVRSQHIRIYGENIFFYTRSGKLITIYRLPNEILKYLKKI